MLHGKEQRYRKLENGVVAGRRKLYPLDIRRKSKAHSIQLKKDKNWNVKVLGCIIMDFVTMNFF